MLSTELLFGTLVVTLLLTEISFDYPMPFSAVSSLRMLAAFVTSLFLLFSGLKLIIASW